MAQVAAKIEQPSEFEQARARWTAFQARREQRREQVEGYEAALQLADHRLARPDAPQNDVLARRAARVLQEHPMSARRLHQQLEDVREELEAIQGQVAAEHDLWQAALAAEHERVALTLQPRHRQAVEAIGQAVEQLSQAITAEREVREEMQATGLAPLGSALLPDCSSMLRVGTLDEWSSRASAWARDMHRIGIIR
jgi:uncharacterized protein YukE